MRSYNVVLQVHARNRDYAKRAVAHGGKVVSVMPVVRPRLPIHARVFYGVALVDVKVRGRRRVRRGSLLAAFQKDATKLLLPLGRRMVEVDRRDVDVQVVGLVRLEPGHPAYEQMARE